MNYILNGLKFLFLFLCTLSYAIDSKEIEEKANQRIKTMYETLNKSPKMSMAERIDWISAQFMNQPYLLGALGEGHNGRYDQYPLYRVDGFDCDTYVNTVVALALSHSLHSFQKNINQLRYKDGKIDYISRNHFASLDWNQNNQRRDILRDITPTIKDKNQAPVALMAEALTDKPNWYANKTTTAIRLEEAKEELIRERLAELKQRGSQLTKTLDKVPYIPLTVLFNANKEPNEWIFAQIPNGSIIEIIRPNWDLREKIGTALNVSHLGFAIRKGNDLYFRQASSEYSKVVEVLLTEYLKKALESPTIKGINVEVVPDKYA